MFCFERAAHPCLPASMCPCLLYTEVSYMNLLVEGAFLNCMSFTAGRGAYTVFATFLFISLCLELT